ncbi:MAG: heat-inducible transcriptional repressor HrcA [Methylococcaceae bacterium]
MNPPSNPQLNERAQHLLKVLVERYIGEGLPVGSRALARDAGLNLSPATIRNVMSDLEELGLITAPHTSAGRMPTVTGYRLFVDTLLTVRPVQQGLVQQLWSYFETQDTPEELLETASRLLSEVTHLAGLVMIPRRESQVFRHFEFLPLSEQRILVILVTMEGEVLNKIINPPRSFSASELQSAANYLNATFAGRELRSIRENLQQELQDTREKLQAEMINAAEIAGLALAQDDVKRRRPFVLTGEMNLLDFAELSGVDQVRALFEAFRQREGIVQILDRCLETSGVKIFIGEEAGYRALDQCSVVTSAYSVNEEIIGVLGVIGPTRMAYERVIPVVDITAKLLGAALNQKSLSPC